MQAHNTTIINQAHTALKSIYGSRLNKVILFGSYARGEQTPESDIDLLVVLNDKNLETGKEISAITDSLFNIGFQNNISISAHPVSEVRFSTEPNYFFNRVKKEGKVL